MNIVDYVIIGIIGISVLFGLYRGFIASVLNMGCGLMSFLASFWVSPKLAAAVQSNQSFLNMLLHYTDASSRIGDLETAITNVATLTSQSINSILEKVNLPAPLDTLLRVNLATCTPRRGCPPSPITSARRFCRQASTSSAFSSAFWCCTLSSPSC